MIYKRMVAVMGAISHVAKSRTNPQHKYRFRGIDDVYNALHPALVEHEVFCAPSVLEREVREVKTQRTTMMLVTLTVRHRFWTVDGSYVDTVTVGEGWDTSDKASLKAMSAAYKYALFETFCIPTEESKDPEDASGPENGVDAMARDLGSDPGQLEPDDIDDPEQKDALLQEIEQMIHDGAKGDSEAIYQATQFFEDKHGGTLLKNLTNAQLAGIRGALRRRMSEASA